MEQDGERIDTYFETGFTFGTVEPNEYLTMRDLSFFSVVWSVQREDKRLSNSKTWKAKRVWMKDDWLTYLRRTGYKSPHSTKKRAARASEEVMTLRWECVGSCIGRKVVKGEEEKEEEGRGEKGCGRFKRREEAPPPGPVPGSSSGS